MNLKLVESLAEIIKSLVSEQKLLLNHKLNHPSGQQIYLIYVSSKSQERTFSKTAALE